MIRTDFSSKSFTDQEVNNLVRHRANGAYGLFRFSPPQFTVTRTQFNQWWRFDLFVNFVGPLTITQLTQHDNEVIPCLRRSNAAVRSIQSDRLLDHFLLPRLYR
jgi:hypothetical protein